MQKLGIAQQHRNKQIIYDTQNKKASLKRTIGSYECTVNADGLTLHSPYSHTLQFTAKYQWKEIELS